MDSAPDIHEKEIDLSKVYNFPKKLVLRQYKGFYLVIYTEGIMWLVLNNEDELKVFKLLSDGYPVQTVLNLVKEESVISVITQIEAKGFDHPKKSDSLDRDMYIYLTNRCNQRCRHCYMFAGDVEFKELTCEQWINVLDDFKNSGGHGVTFTGGEVTLYQGFEKIIKHAHDIGLVVTVLTNGILWDKSKIENLENYLDEVQVSIDGYDKDSYFSVRQYDGFDRAIQCVKDLCACGIRVSIAVTPLFENLVVFSEKFEPLARKMLEDYPQLSIKFNLELIPGRKINVTAEENKDYKRIMRELVERLYPGYYTEAFVLNYENHVIRKNCGFGGISIAADGQVFWCNRIHELSSSVNILDTCFTELFKESDRIINDTSVDNVTECKNCEIRYVCGGGCRLKYSGIKEVGLHRGEWQHTCEGKDIFYDKMIKSNEYFYE